MELEMNIENEKVLFRGTPEEIAEFIEGKTPTKKVSAPIQKKKRFYKKNIGKPYTTAELRDIKNLVDAYEQNIAFPGSVGKLAKKLGRTSASVYTMMSKERKKKQ